MKIVDVATDYRPGVREWIDLLPDDVRTAYRLWSDVYAEWSEEQDTVSPKRTAEARALWRRLSESCKDLDGFLAAEEAAWSAPADLMQDYNAAWNAWELSLDAHTLLEWDTGMPEETPAITGDALAGSPLMRGMAGMPEETPAITGARLEVATMWAARAVRHQVAGNWGSAMIAAQRGLDGAFNHADALAAMRDGPNQLLALAEMRLTSIYVEARSRLNHLPIMDEIAHNHLAGFTNADSAEWEVSLESPEYCGAWPSEDRDCWIAERFRTGVQGPVEAGYAARLTDDLVTRTAAFGGLFDDSIPKRLSRATPPRPGLDEDTLTAIKRGIEAMHDRFDHNMNIQLDIWTDTNQIKDVVTTGAERATLADRFLREAVKGWEWLQAETRKEMSQSEVGVRSILAGESSGVAAPQVAATLWRAFERERRLNRSQPVPGESEFNELRNRALHADDFTTFDLEKMRALLLGIGTRGDGILQMLARSAMREQRR